MNFKTLLVTGGCGFIGSNFIRYILNENEQLKIITVDKLTYAGNLSNLSDFEKDSNHIFIKHDICNYKALSKVFELHKPDAVINFAAESHVDRSIKNPGKFLETNVGGTLSLLNLSLEYDVKKYVQISTDEVYGSLGDEGLFTEETPISPNSPYSASKASADHFVMAYNETYGLSTVITRCSNNYGPFQFPEKLVPLLIKNAMAGDNLPIYGDGLNIRDWIYVEDHCRGIWKALRNGKRGQVYNFGGNFELSNVDMAKNILSFFPESSSKIHYVNDRQGHDFRYAIDFSKAEKDLNWVPLTNFQKGLSDTINWYKNNSEWLSLLINGDYIKYYEEHYNIA